MLKNILSTSLILFVLAFIFAFKREPPAGELLNTFPPSGMAIKTIIVDAGHGGSDVGARGNYSYEKDICLAVSLKLGKLLEEEFKDVKVLYTRTTDVYPAIKERADFANANKGDLFVSIHVNAGPMIRHSKFAGYKKETYYTGKGKNRKKKTRTVPKYTSYFTPNPSRGTETYIWAADRAGAKGDYVTERLSEVVNDSTEFAPDFNDPVFKAQSLLWTKKYFDKSLLLANLVEEEFVKEGRESRGVKQRNEKGIWVLQATAMPSILVETGFISHRPDEDYLNSKKGQETIAANVLSAIKRYRAATEGR
jgi:N-acetylmuramoyl-L-alanine amidase